MPVFVNGKEITDDQVHLEMQYHPAASVEEARHKSAVALTIKELLLQEAANLSIFAPANCVDNTLIEEYLINAILEQNIPEPEPQDQDCLSFYQKNQQLFMDSNGNCFSFEKMKEKIAEYLSDMMYQASCKHYICGLVKKAKIIGIELTDYP